MNERISEVKRKTSETDITVKINLDGSGKYDINTGIGFLNHMLEAFARHGSFDLNINCQGDLNVDCHHSVEDIGIALGECVKNALGLKEQINRYGHCIMPMDDALVLCAVDLSGRPYYVSNIVYTTEKLGNLDTDTISEFFYAFSYSCAMNLHFQYFNGNNNHHIAEAAFKSFANALKIAVSIDKNITGVLSTKGVL